MEIFSGLIDKLGNIIALLIEYGYSAVVFGMSLLALTAFAYLIVWVSGLAKDKCSSPECA